jgi:hypothetical protein
LIVRTDTGYRGAVAVPRDRVRFVSAGQLPADYFPMVHSFGIPDGASIPLTSQYTHRFVLTMSYDLAEREDFAASVLLAQTASELGVEGTVRALMSEQLRADLRDWMIGQVRSFSLQPKNRPLRELFAIVTGTDTLAQQAFWSQVPTHLDRRNGVAHRGQVLLDKEDVDHSIATVLGLLEYVESFVVEPRDSHFPRETDPG